MGPVHEELAPTYIELSKKNSLLPYFWLHPVLFQKGDVFPIKKELIIMNMKLIMLLYNQKMVKKNYTNILMKII